MDIEIVVRSLDPMYDMDGPHIRADVVFQAPVSPDDGAPINAAEVAVFFPVEPDISLAALEAQAILEARAFPARVYAAS